MNKQAQILNALKVIIDPDLGKDIVTLNFIKNLVISKDDDVSLDIELTTPACPIKEQFKQQATEAINALGWVKSIAITMTAQKKAKTQSTDKLSGLSQVNNIIAVSSCKGGVGKSTVAVNLACSIARTGAKVGLFDADIYGPSLSTLIKVKDDGIYQENNLIVPLKEHGLKLMSFGYVNKKSDEAAIMRGPMVSQVVTQLLQGTNWGELDYLIIDMPPGTGDIHLTIAQNCPITASVIVTTPQKLSFIDVVKGIQMFDTLKIPTVGVIENMSHFEDSQGVKNYIFGQGASEKLVKTFGFKHSFSIAMDPKLSSMSDEGIPLIISEPNGTIAKNFSDMTASLIREVSRIKHSNNSLPIVTYDDKNITINNNGEISSISNKKLRDSCQCAHCVEEFTRKKIIDVNAIAKNIKPTAIRPLGNYAISVAWSDGHSSSIYPYTDLLKN